MEYTGTEAQTKFCDGIFDLLVSTGLVKEGKHYFKESMTWEDKEGKCHTKEGLVTWEDKLHNVVSEAGLSILAAIDE